ncbi:hypothetical protein GWK48_07095 [Metallosphaera tengchongensis]|uniref:PD-(D/E)XK endonuclease-like domain-containing protein n=1 Tax=Metallosphaera tengchongensis TaxID=1532350 RepID=A0A6N0NX20_9CREN|nr:hypothetical protein [Metallosphaera tengchongensis]QKR00169.1 hypothetical protein GWK48_07095 [Metallosphaera tengchongensis]
MVVKEIIYRNLVEKDYHDPYEGEYWPSQLWNCLRKQYYDRVFPMPLSMDSARFTTLGNALHDIIAELLKKEESVRVTSEVPVRIPHPTNHEIVISGRADDLIVVEFTKERYLVEVKSVDDLRNKLSKGFLPRKDHKAQLNLYLKAFPKSKGILLYVDRSNFDMEEIQVEFEEELYKKTLERAFILHSALKGKSTPKAEAKLDEEMKWQCGFCVHKARCDREPDNPQNQ